jgi:hypothetical protein
MALLLDLPFIPATATSSPDVLGTAAFLLSGFQQVRKA